MSKYNVDFKKLAMLLLPVCLRKNRLTALAQAVITPLSMLGTDFKTFRDEKNYRLTHNGQTCYLRALLNDKFDPIGRGITVTDNTSTNEAVIIHKRETSLFATIPMRSGAFLEIFRRGFGGSTSLGFWVNIPERLNGNINEAAVRAVVNTFKLASIRYGINYI